MITQISEEIKRLITQRLWDRNQKGFETYGQTLDDVPFENYDWNMMINEELLDALQYAIKENFRLSNMLKETGVKKKVTDVFKVFREDVWRTYDKKEDVRDNLMNAVLGLNGEAGEVADVFKKVWYHGHNSSRSKVIDELGDVMYYVSLLADLMDSSLEEVVTKNIIKRGKRYPNGFSVEDSIKRVDMEQVYDVSSMYPSIMKKGDEIDE